MEKSDYPCWLTSDQLAEAQALIELGFNYCGEESDFCLELDLFDSRVGSWKFYWTVGEVALDAVCDGALYSRCLEFEQDSDEDWTAKQLADAKAAIKRVQRRRKLKKPKQLSLF